MKKDGLIGYRLSNSYLQNTEDVTWMNKVHERITGYDTFSNFPTRTMVFVSS